MKQLIYAVSLTMFVNSISSCSLTGKLPVATGQPPEVPDLPASFIGIPVTTNFQPVEDHLNAVAPSRFTNPAFPGENSESAGLFNACYKFEVTRSPIILNGTGNQFQLGGSASYYVKGSYPCNIFGLSCGCCGEGPRHLNIGYTISNVSFTSDYSIATQTSLSQLDAPDRCQVSLFKIDVTGKVLDAARGPLQNVAAQIDGFVAANSSFKQYAQTAWTELNKDIKLDEGVFLKLAPQKLQASGINAVGKSLTVSIGLVAQPVITTTTSANPVLDMPALDTNPMSGNFNLYWDIKSNYDFLTTELKKAIVGKKLFDPSNPKIFIIPEDVELYGLGDNHVALKVVGSGKIKFKRYRKITFFIMGTPTFNPATSELTVPDADYVVDTGGKDPILSAGLDLFKLPIRAQMRQAKYNISKLLDDGKKRLTDALNRDITPSIKMEGTVQTLQGVFILPRASEIIFRTSMTGNAAVTIKDLVALR